MRQGAVRRAAFACVVTLCAVPPAAAGALERWQETAIGFITQFEGSSFDAVTLDSDCQGLSLGKEQYAVLVNSTQELFREMDRMAGPGGVTAIVAATATQRRDEIAAFVAQSMAGDAARMPRVRSWQQIRVGDRWRDLDEGECKQGQKRSVGAKDLRLKPGFEADLKAFLKHPVSVRAQGSLVARRAAKAIDRATCWARAERNAAAPTFKEYLFFFDYLIQNGDSFTANGLLQQIALRIAFNGSIADARQDPAAVAKMAQLVDWLGADFPHMRNKAIKTDHGDYARANAAAWQARFKAGQISKSDLRLAYVGLMRAMLGNNQWAYNAMNRRGTIAFSGGLANGRTYEAGTFAALISAAGDMPPAEVQAIACN